MSRLAFSANECKATIDFAYQVDELAYVQRYVDGSHGVRACRRTSGQAVVLGVEQFLMHQLFTLNSIWIWICCASQNQRKTIKNTKPVFSCCPFLSLWQINVSLLNLQFNVI